MTEYDVRWDFKRGDVIAKLEGTTKWVVTGYGEFHGMSGLKWHTYHTQRLNEQGRLGEWSSMVYEFCRDNCIKIGEWDFKNGREIDDVE